MDIKKMAIVLNGFIHVEQFFFWNTIAAVIVIFATGGIRTFTYVDNFYGKEIEESRRKLLVIKHIVLFAIFGISEYLAYIMTFH